MTADTINKRAYARRDTSVSCRSLHYYYLPICACICRSNRARNHPRYERRHRSRIYLYRDRGIIHRAFAPRDKRRSNNRIKRRAIVRRRSAPSRERVNISLANATRLNLRHGVANFLMKFSLRVHLYPGLWPFHETPSVGYRPLPPCALTRRADAFPAQL